MTSIVWISFILIIVGLLFLDMKVLHRDNHAIGIREGLKFFLMWLSLGLAFNVFVYFAYEHHWLGLGQEIGNPLTGKDAALKFLTGYLIEKSLSIDNLFVMAMIFGYFKTPAQHQHRILFWGVLGAIVFRAVMIVVGAALIRNFEWITYVFGGLLLYSAIHMLRSNNESVDPNKNVLVRFVKAIYPVSLRPDASTFFTIENGKRAVTMLFLALLVIETTDIVFAVDSIPAIFAVTTDPFIVFTSNIFAILGLRSLYFLLAAAMHQFRYLKVSLVFILSFVAVKMLLAHYLHIPVWVTLVVIVFFLVGGILASLFAIRQKTPSQSDDTPSP